MATRGSKIVSVSESHQEWEKNREEVKEERDEGRVRTDSGWRSAARNPG